MQIKKILDRLMAYFQINTGGELAEKLGVAPSTISTWKVRNTIDYELLFAKCESVNLNWLITGEGEMLISDEEKMRKTLEKSEPHLFNINLKYLREQQEWSALQVSKKLDLAWATYTAYETATWPRPETLVKISEMYNVTIDDLVKKDLQISPKTELNNNSRIQDLTDIIKSKDEIIALQKELLQELKNKKQTKKIAGIEVEEKH